MRTQRHIEITAKTLCKSGKFETGEGCCAAICMSALGSARQNCRYVMDVHGKLASDIVVALEEDDA